MSYSINYQHLFYFWNVVKENSFTRASKKLGLAQPTVSGQISTFEKSLGMRLLTRQGRRISLTDTGHIVYNYAEKIFTLGEQMSQDIQSSSYFYHHNLIIGYRNSISSLIIGKISEFMFDKMDNHRLTYLIESNDYILNGVVRKTLDFAVTDEPLSYHNGVPLYAHQLLESNISVFSNHEHREQSFNTFPQLLKDEPCIMPSQNSRIRKIIDDYLLEHKINPIIIAEVENYDLLFNISRGLKCFFFAPSVFHKEIESLSRCRRIFTLTNSVIKYYAVTLDKEPAKDIVAHVVNKSQLMNF